MPKARRRAVLKVVLLGLVAGGLCGAAVGFGLVTRGLGIAAAIGIAFFVGLSVYRVSAR